MWIYLLLLVLPISSGFNENVRYEQLGTTVFKLFTPDKLSLEIDLHDYLLTARKYGGGIGYTRNCSRPVKVAFEKCGTTILESSLNKTDNLTFQDVWIHHLIATLRKKCYNEAPNLFTITLTILARTDTDCEFTFTSVKRLGKTKKPVLEFPRIHIDMERMVKTEVFKTDISTQQNFFTSSVSLETTLRGPAKVAIGKCGYYDPYKVAFNISDHEVLGTLNRLSALVCDLDKTNTFDTIIFSDPFTYGQFRYQTQDSIAKTFVVTFLVPFLLILDTFLLYVVVFHFIHRRSPVIVIAPVHLERGGGVPLLTKVLRSTPRMDHF